MFNVGTLISVQAQCIPRVRCLGKARRGDQIGPGRAVTSPAKGGSKRIGLGLAALGQPGDINLRNGDLTIGGRDQDAMRCQAHRVLDAAYHAGIRTFDAARSHGQAKASLAEWLKSRQFGPHDVQLGGYTYTADWQVQANQHKVKEHSLPNFIWQ